jgi:hypothetical protein
VLGSGRQTRFWSGAHVVKMLTLYAAARICSIRAPTDSSETSMITVCATSKVGTTSMTSSVTMPRRPSAST